MREWPVAIYGDFHYAGGRAGRSPPEWSKMAQKRKVQCSAEDTLDLTVASYNIGPKLHRDR